MNRTFKGSLLVGYFILSITFMETIFHVNIYKDFTLQHLGISLLFMSVIGIAMAVIVLFFKDRSAWVVSIVLLGFISIVYISQMIYYAFFKTFYSLYSVGKGLTVTQFWKDILQTVGANIVWVLLFLLPVIILALFGKGYFSFRRGNLFTIGIYVFMAVVLQLSAIGLIYVSERGQHSAYELYFDQHFPLQATEKLGLLTSVRLDVQRTLTNWSPTLSTPPKLTEAASPVDGDKDASATEESEEEEIKYQTMDIDFDALIEEASDEEFKELHTYFSNKEPTEENDMTGKYEGYNLILL